MLKLNTKDSIPGIATTRSIGLVNRQPAPSYGLGAAKPRGQRLRGRSRCPETFRSKGKKNGTDCMYVCTEEEESFRQNRREACKMRERSALRRMRLHTGNTTGVELRM